MRLGGGLTPVGTLRTALVTVSGFNRLVTDEQVSLSIAKTFDSGTGGS